MKKAEERRNQECLEVCSSYDYDLFNWKERNDIERLTERITYLVSSLGIINIFNSLFENIWTWRKKLTKNEKKEKIKYLDVSKYYEDERIWKKKKNH